ncbi:MAG: tRNA (adenosine(37)-N6)-threonylcarbamoyltransferase complex ATPase subunit type 1 TsaE [Thermohalobaculum sp.]|nr:tRNA (adenosine(37)-N6)-threonylcarbamoyltransferase complex ATPase subunit type 1 TsaE [Thermohalobaculum sp.]
MTTAEPAAKPAAEPAAARLILPAEAATAALGAQLAGGLAPGDVVALWGGLGAGKSVLARAILRALLGDAAAAIPSPSYTLVNVYDTPRGEVWHADLYRLAGPGEALELGLIEAMAGGAILLIEWPDRLGADLPARRLDIALAPLPAPAEPPAAEPPALAAPARDAPGPDAAAAPDAPAPGPAAATAPARAAPAAATPTPKAPTAAPTAPTAERFAPTMPAAEAPIPGDEPRAATITAHGPGWGRALERLGGQG